MGPVVVPTTAEILSLIAILVTCIGLWRIETKSKAKDDSELIRRVIILETQMEPLWHIIEDSVLKSVIHNPLTMEERAALSRYHHRKGDTAIEDLLCGKAGLQRELKMLEENPHASAESTLPYVLSLAAIEKRLIEKGHANK